MLSIPGYRVVEEIYSSARTTITRAYRLEGERPVLLKALSAKHPDAIDIARIRREYEILTLLTGRDPVPGVVACLGLETWRNFPVLVLEDTKSVSLSASLKTRPVRLLDFCQTALALAAALSGLRRHHVVHKEICPDNVVITPDGRPILVDFGIASRLSSETAQSASIAGLEGNLAFIAPEQTGRMNRVVDYRSDFYSLGAVFYQMLAGRPPFVAVDPNELVHSHIARAPDPLKRSKAGEDVPGFVNGIILKLLSKAPEDRYQSSYGLIHDLERASRALTEGAPVSFVLGERDVPDTLQIPQKLYGRERPLEILTKTFMDASRGAKCFLSVSGEAGVGKSVLIQEIRRPVAEKRGFFLSGKFDQYRRDIPYQALVQAFQVLIRSLLSESNARIEVWKHRIVSALGMNAQVLVDIIPELHYILGEQAPVPELSPTESRNRLLTTFQNFIKVFCGEEHPLLLFLDDVQWADSGTLELVPSLLSDPALSHLLIIAAYRDTETGESHPLFLAVEELRRSGVPVERLKLNPLGPVDVDRFIADALFLESDASGAKAPPTDLSEFVFRKTNGNPFFVASLLSNLAESGLVYFSADKGRWDWDMLRIKASGVSDDVLALLASNIQKISPLSRATLKVASCLGNQFDLLTLSKVLQTPAQETAQALDELLTEGFLLPTNDRYKYAASGASDELLRVVGYRFVHDRVHQAAYSLLSDEERQRLHLTIGRAMLNSLDHAGIEENILDIVNHLNAGRNLILDPDELVKLAEFNLRAGRKAKEACAYDSAVLSFHIALEKLPPDAPRTLTDLYLALELELGETYAVMNQPDNAGKHFDQVIKHGPNRPERFRVFEVQIALRTARGELEEAVRLGEEGLALIGIKISGKAGNIPAPLRKDPARLLGFSSADTANPEAVKAHNAMKLLANAAIPANLEGTAKFEAIVSHMIRLSADHGNFPASSYAYAAHGAIAAAGGNWEEAERFGRAAIDLVEKMRAREVRGRVYYIYASSVQHWSNHIAEKSSYVTQAYQSSLEAGDLAHAASSLFLMHASPLWAGTLAISHVTEQMDSVNHSLHRTGQRFTIDLVKMLRQYILNIQGAVKTRTRLTGDWFNEDEKREEWTRLANRNGLFFLHLTRTILLCFFENPEEAFASAREALSYQDSASGSYAVVLAQFFYGIAAAMAVPGAEKKEQARFRSALDAAIAQFGKWVEHCPENFEHFAALLIAERCRAQSDHAGAFEAFDRAVELAHRAGAPLYAAYANERAGSYYASKERLSFAEIYWKRARDLYREYGFTAKASDLERAHPALFAAAGPLPGLTLGGPATPSQSKGETLNLDLGTVVKASQTLSSEIHLEKLLTKMASIVMESAGAQRAFVLLEATGGLVVKAACEMGKDPELSDVPLESAPIPAGIVQYVYRTSETVVVYDAEADSRFKDDPYVRDFKPKSVLCLPILLKGRLAGILYLENNSLRGGFTTDRVELLNMLSAQIAA
ncbi:MAG: AAA family ATPase, partial [Spirochaetia bacterium]|nr:AAA family ATPase [Spirochaetia bacterium]